MTDLRATEHPPLPRREGDEQSDEEQCRDRPLDDQSLRILKSPSDVHLPPPDQADDPDNPEQAGSHQSEGTGLRAEPHQPIREVEDEDPPDGHEDGYEIKALVEDSVEPSQGRRRPQQGVGPRNRLDARVHRHRPPAIAASRPRATGRPAEMSLDSIKG